MAASCSSAPDSCAACGRLGAELRCDYPVPGRKSGTCDAWLCSGCAVHSEPDFDVEDMGLSAVEELEDLLQQLDPVDLVIVEGFKMGDQPKIQVVRPENAGGATSSDGSGRFWIEILGLTAILGLLLLNLFYFKARGGSPFLVTWLLIALLLVGSTGSACKRRAGWPSRTSWPTASARLW